METASNASAVVLPPSLPEGFASVRLPAAGASAWRRMLAFTGPGLLVAVGYMDPGNWATDLAGGSQFGYLLLSVVLFSNVLAMLLQYLALKLGIATGLDLAQACRAHYSRPVSVALWLFCEVAIVACDLAEVIGSAIALNLLFGLPLVVGVLLTAADVLVILVLQQRGFRYLEASGRRTDRADRRVFPLRGRRLATGLDRRARRVAAAAAGGRDGRRCTLRWASWGRRSCRTTSTCTRPSCRRATSRATTPDAPRRSVTRRWIPTSRWASRSSSTPRS